MLSYKGENTQIIEIIHQQDFKKFKLPSKPHAFSYNPVEKILEKLHKLRKSGNHKRNIKGTYNEKLHYNCLQQLAILRIKT